MSDSSNEPIPVFRLDPEEVPRRLRFEAWREIIRPIVDVTPLAHERRFELRYEAYTLDGLVLSESTAGAHGLERGPRHLRRGDTDHITLPRVCGRW